MNCINLLFSYLPGTYSVDACEKKAEQKIEMVKFEQQTSCVQQIQTAQEQLKHEHVLDKRKAIEEALQLARKRQQAEQAQLDGQKAVQWKLASQQKQQRIEQRRQLLQGSVQRKKDEVATVEQQQLGPANQLPKQVSGQQEAENEAPQQQPRSRQRQRRWQLAADLVRLPQQQSSRQQANEVERQSEKRQYVEQQVPEQQESGMKHAAPQQQAENPQPRLDDTRVVQNKLDQLQQQDVVDTKQNSAGEQAPVVSGQNDRQPPNQQLQESGSNVLQQQKQDQQKSDQQLVFQVPPPGHVGEYQQRVHEWLASSDVQAPRADSKQQNVDASRQQQFEQLQHDKLHEQSPLQKGV